MNVLMFSTDENIFKEGSEVRSRMFEYGKLVEELHIVIKNQKSKIKNQNFGNIFLYPTNDKFNFLYFSNAYKISKKIICKLKATSCKTSITCQDPFETGLIGYFLKKKFSAQGGSASGGKIPLQIQIHTDFLSPYFWRESFKNKIRVIMAKYLIKKADCIRAVSERIKKSVVENCKLKIENSAIAVLPIFVDIEKIRQASIITDLQKKYPGRFIILMASRFTREKNIGLAIRAIKNLIPDYPNILLLVVGDGPELNKLQVLSSKFHVQEDVIFEPWIDDLYSYYKTADLFLLTSNYEGYGRTVIEAAAAGLPVVMTDVGVSIGSVIPAGDLKKLIENLNILISNSLEREKILENQRRVLNNMPSKGEYLGLIKQLWSRCLDIEDPRFQSES